jgi:hypothetical protein
MSTNIIETAEVRTIESTKERNATRLATWYSAYRKGKIMGRVGRLCEAAIIYNIFVSEAWRTAGSADWKDYCKRIRLNRMTAERHVNVGYGLLKLCPSACFMEDGKFLFDEKKIVREFGKFFEDNPKVTLEDIGRMNESDSTIVASFFDEQAGHDIPTEDLLAALCAGTPKTQSSDTSSPEASAKSPAHHSAWLQAYAEEHGLVYDRVRGWINGDGSDLTEHQRADMTSYDVAIDGVESTRLSITKYVGELRSIVDTKLGAYTQYMLKGNKRFAEASESMWRDVLMQTKRIEIAAEAMHCGEIDRAKWALTAPAEAIIELI